MPLPVRPLRAAVPNLSSLARAMDGSGPALLTDPAPHVVAALRPEDGVPEDVAVVVPTSGSTGTPKGVMLSPAALRASAVAAAARLGGTGRWLLALPPTHVGGLQVLVRSLLAGEEPALLPPGPFTTVGFATVTGCRYTALVPTQLGRLLRHPPAVAALQGYDAVLLGGAAAPAALLEAARAAGVRVVTTYGMSETAGGCVYDGVPLDGVEADLDETGRVLLRGPVLANGYRDGTPVAGPDGWFRTSDVGRHEDGRLVVLGRADDVITTGGEKVAPLAVEDALASHPAVVEAAVAGLPDPEWGQRVVAWVVLRGPLDLEQARAHVRARLGRAAAPRELRVREALPHLPSGKVDRLALREERA